MEDVTIIDYPICQAMYKNGLVEFYRDKKSLGAFRIKPESYHEDRVALAKEHGITEFDFYVMNPNSSAESVAYVGQDTACAADGRTWFRVYRYNLEKVLGSEVYIS